jgi:membrane protein implicated in regulation of membrane protease activity
MRMHEWWVLAALGLGICELLSGTFYLLMLAVGCLAGGAAAWLSAGFPAQLFAAAALTGLAWLVLRLWHPARTRVRAATADPDVLLDIGARVEVSAWNAQGRAEVSYRGARWQARLDPALSAPAQPSRPGPYRIRAFSGNELLLEPLEDASAPG